MNVEADLQRQEVESDTVEEEPGDSEKDLMGGERTDVELDIGEALVGAADRHRDRVSGTLVGGAAIRVVNVDAFVKLFGLEVVLLDEFGVDVVERGSGVEERGNVGESVVGR